MPDLVERVRIALAERYGVESELGRGGMGVVVLAEDLKHPRRVAIKVLLPEVAASLGVERFLREIEIGARLQHPHILPLHDSGEADGLLYYVMPYVEGETLRDRLTRERQLPLGDTLQIAREVGDALSYAHRQGVIHRDVKPENILLSGGHAAVADFGVARAVSAAGTRPLTASGIAVGTTNYMSPEQASGGSADGRSDLYGLACVVYEMLVGEPPFTGPTPQAVIARHLSETPPSLRVVRPSVPAEVEDAIAVALAKTPADRQATVSQFVEALTRPPGPPSAAPKRSRAGWTAALLLAVALAATWPLVRNWLGRTTTDPLHLMVLPFDHRKAAPPTVLNGDLCQWRLAEALRHWEGITIADNFEIGDARQRRGDPPPTQREFLAIARDLGAGQLVRGEVAQIADTVYLTASAFDVSHRGRLLHQAALSVPAIPDSVAASFVRLAANLLGLAPSGAAVERWSTRSIPAGRAFVEGSHSLSTGDFVRAGQGFQEAARLDPVFADAHFWLAQTLAWDGKDPNEWAAAAQHAVDLRDRLTDTRAALLAEPLLDLARRRYPQACAHYAAVLARDSANFAAWFGLGECQFRDDRVLPDRASPSGWRFRSSYEAAARAYRRGLAAAPALTGGFFFRLYRLLFVEPSRVRDGYAASGDSASFWAYPALDHDTVALVPFPAADVRASKPGTVPATHESALSHDREVLREIAVEWARAYPASPDAHLAVAAMLESLARVGAGDDEVRAALAETRRAHALARQDVTRLRSAHAEVRLLLKLGQFAEARDRADSLLRNAGTPEPEQSARLAGVAALTGRAHRAAELLGHHAPELSRGQARFQNVPLPVLQVRERLRAYAAMGGPPDSLRALAARADSLLRLAPHPTVPEEVLAALPAEPAALAFPTLGASALPPQSGGNDLVEMQRLLVAGHTSELRSRLDALRALRRNDRPQDVVISRTYGEVALLLALGDTAAATTRLEGALGRLPGFAAPILSDVPDAAGLVRAMALRAQLAARAHDPATAQKWATAVATLWRDADAELQPLVREMSAWSRGAQRRN